MENTYTVELFIAFYFMNEWKRMDIKWIHNFHLLAFCCYNLLNGIMRSQYNLRQTYILISSMVSHDECFKLVINCTLCHPFPSRAAFINDGLFLSRMKCELFFVMLSVPSTIATPSIVLKIGLCGLIYHLHNWHDVIKVWRTECIFRSF